MKVQQNYSCDNICGLL